jgi:hypothetical protein
VNAVVAWEVVLGPLGACLRLEDKVIVHKRNEISRRGGRFEGYGVGGLRCVKGCFMRQMETAVRFT